MLAGVSAEYYARMERGNLAGASEAVLDSLAPMQLDESERAHLMEHEELRLPVAVLKVGGRGRGQVLVHARRSGPAPGGAGGG